METLLEKQCIFQSLPATCWVAFAHRLYQVSPCASIQFLHARVSAANFGSSSLFPVSADSRLHVCKHAVKVHLQLFYFLCFILLCISAFTHSSTLQHFLLLSLPVVVYQTVIHIPPSFSLALHVIPFPAIPCGVSVYALLKNVKLSELSPKNISSVFFIKSWKTRILLKLQNKVVRKFVKCLFKAGCIFKRIRM